uniref:PIR Superfamily Protein n=1 Tax=Strongyloides papillosus TaxID=174720 RepID=A0A0N5B946_STREA
MQPSRKSLFEKEVDKLVEMFKDLSITREKYYYNSMDELLKACFNFSQGMRYVETRNRNMSKYTIDKPRYQNYYKDCKAVHLTGYISFGEHITTYSRLSEIGYGIGERCILHFYGLQYNDFGFSSGEYNESAKSLKLSANIHSKLYRTSYDTHIA